MPFAYKIRYISIPSAPNSKEPKIDNFRAKSRYFSKIAKNCYKIDFPLLLLTFRHYFPLKTCIFVFFFDKNRFPKIKFCEHLYIEGCDKHLSATAV